MVEGGIDDILIPNQIVTEDKITRLCSVAERARVSVAVDNAENVQNLSRIASDRGVSIGVVIEVDTSMGRGGIRGKEHGVELAKLAHSLPGIDFKGVMSHQTLDGSPRPRDPFHLGPQVHPAVPGREGCHRGRGDTGGGGLLR